jgi:hypothetical protein
VPDEPLLRSSLIGVSGIAEIGAARIAGCSIRVWVCEVES